MAAPPSEMEIETETDAFTEDVCEKEKTSRSSFFMTKLPIRSKIPEEKEVFLRSDEIMDEKNDTKGFPPYEPKEVNSVRLLDEESFSSEDALNRSPNEIAKGWHRLVSFNTALNEDELFSSDSEPEGEMNSMPSPTEVARRWHKLVSQDSEIKELSFAPYSSASIPVVKPILSDSDEESFGHLEDESESVDASSEIAKNYESDTTNPIEVELNEEVQVSDKADINVKHKTDSNTEAVSENTISDNMKRSDDKVVDTEIEHLAGELKQDVKDLKKSLEKMIKFFIPPVILIPVSLLFLCIITLLKVSKRVTVAWIQVLVNVLPKLYNGIVRFHKRQFRGLLKLIFYWYHSLSKVIHLSARMTTFGCVFVVQAVMRTNKALLRFGTRSILYLLRCTGLLIGNVWFFATESAIKPVLILFKIGRKLVTFPFWGTKYFVRVVTRLVKHARENKEEFIDLLVAVFGLAIIGLVATGYLFPFIHDFFTGKNRRGNYYVIEIPVLPMFRRSSPTVLSRISFGLL